MTCYFWQQNHLEYEKRYVFFQHPRSTFGPLQKRCCIKKINHEINWGPPSFRLLLWKNSFVGTFKHPSLLQIFICLKHYLRHSSELDIWTGIRHPSKIFASYEENKIVTKALNLLKTKKIIGLGSTGKGFIVVILEIEAIICQRYKRALFHSIFILLLIKQILKKYKRAASETQIVALAQNRPWFENLQSCLF